MSTLGGVVNQFNAAGELTHLLTLEGLPKEQIVHILDTAKQFVSVTDPSREVKKVPLLRGKSVFNLFFENSTRTRTTFEIAAKRVATGQNSSPKIRHSKNWHAS